MKRAFLTGGTGFIGKHVLEALLQTHQYEVVVLSRRHQPRTSDVIYVTGDISDKKRLNEIVTGFDIVIHLAGCKNIVGSLYATNVIGTENMIDVCLKNHVSKLIYLSSVGVIGPSPHEDIDEQTPCKPRNLYETSKRQAEILVSKYSGTHPHKVLILRPTNVYGENDPEHHLLNLITKIKQHRFYYVGKDVSKFTLNYLYVKEISRFVIDALNHETPSDLYILNTPVSLERYVSAIKKLLEDSVPVRRLPYWPIKMMALGFDCMPKIIMKNPPINSHKLNELTNQTKYSSARLIRETGWTPAYSIEEALHHVISDYVEKGLLS